MPENLEFFCRNCRRPRAEHLADLVCPNLIGSFFLDDLAPAPGSMIEPPAGGAASDVPAIGSALAPQGKDGPAVSAYLDPALVQRYEVYRRALEVIATYPIPIAPSAAGAPLVALPDVLAMREIARDAIGYQPAI